MPVLVAVIYCDERMQRKVSQGESTWSEVPGKSGTNSKDLFLGSHAGSAQLLPPLVVTTHVKHHLSESLLVTLCPEFLLGAARKVAPVPGTDQNSRLLEGKQVFSINYIGTHNLSTLIS